MTTMTETPVATLKAEIVTEFVFTPEYKTRRFGNPTNEILAPYRRDYEAKVGVKVGNTVKEIAIRTHTKYMSSYTDENGRWQSRDDIEYVDIEKVNGETPFAELEAAGILVDLIDVLVQYQANVEVAKYRMTLHNRYQKWEGIRKHKKEYTHSWMHNVEAELKADKNKKIQAALENTTIKVKSLEKFLDHSEHAVTVNYKGVSTSIFMKDGGFTFDGNCTYRFPKDWNGEARYNHRFIIVNGKERRAKRLGTLYLKFVEAVDSEFSIREARKNQLSKEQQERQDKKERLEKITGYPMVILKSTKYATNGRSNVGSSYDVYSFAILTSQPTSRYSDPEYISVDEKVETKYEDGKYVEVGRTYSVKTLKGLTADQMKRILDIAMEGKTTLSKLEIPE
jgi:hypothetical protein